MASVDFQPRRDWNCKIIGTVIDAKDDSNQFWAKTNLIQRGHFTVFTYALTRCRCQRHQSVNIPIKVLLFLLVNSNCEKEDADFHGQQISILDENT